MTFKKKIDNNNNNVFLKINSEVKSVLLNKIENAIMFGTSTGTVKIYELNTFELATEIPYI